MSDEKNLKNSTKASHKEPTNLSSTLKQTNKKALVIVSVIAVLLILVPATLAIVYSFDSNNGDDSKKQTEEEVVEEKSQKQSLEIATQDFGKESDIELFYAQMIQMSENKDYTGLGDMIDLQKFANSTDSKPQEIEDNLDPFFEFFTNLEISDLSFQEAYDRNYIVEESEDIYLLKIYDDAGNYTGTNLVIEKINGKYLITGLRNPFLENDLGYLDSNPSGPKIPPSQNSGSQNPDARPNNLYSLEELEQKTSPWRSNLAQTLNAQYRDGQYVRVLLNRVQADSQQPTLTPVQVDNVEKVQFSILDNLSVNPRNRNMYKGIPESEIGFLYYTKINLDQETTIGFLGDQSWIETGIYIRNQNGQEFYLSHYHDVNSQVTLPAGSYEISIENRVDNHSQHNMIMFEYSDKKDTGVMNLIESGEVKNIFVATVYEPPNAGNLVIEVNGVQEDTILYLSTYDPAIANLTGPDLDKIKGVIIDSPSSVQILNNLTKLQGSTLYSHQQQIPVYYLTKNESLGLWNEENDLSAESKELLKTQYGLNITGSMEGYNPELITVTD